MLPNFVEMQVVEMRQMGNQLAVIEKQVRFNKDQVAALEPITLPSNMKGPDGEPMGIPGTLLRLNCGAGYAVKMSWEQVEAVLSGKDEKKETNVIKFEKE